MKKIVLITCVKEKNTKICSAQKMYIGKRFVSLLAYAQKQQPDHIFILSGKYGLLDLNQKIAPYDLDLHQVSEAVLKKWSSVVLKKLAQHTDLKKDYFILLCSPIYAKYLLPELCNTQMPIAID